LQPYLVSFATGTLLATALLELLPHAIEHIGAVPSLSLVLGGLVLFFILERLMIWRHCHVIGHCETHRTAGLLILIGDTLHNFVDGIVLAAAFLSSIPLGIATGLAVIAHEIPQEVGDFAILIESGFSKKRAFIWNMLSGSATIPGALVTLVALDVLQPATPYVLSLSAAGFLYIGLADLIPGLHERLRPGIGAAQFLFILLGIATILLLHGGHG
jgi:zinc and cadmium transporter